MALKPLILAATLVATAAHAQLPATAIYTTQNGNGGTLAIYKDSRCYTGLAVYSEAPMKNEYARGCVISVDDNGFDAKWATGDERRYDYSGWVAVGGKRTKSSM